MEKNLNAYITKLIELDSKALELKGERDAELLKLEADSRNELKSIEDMLEEAALMAKQEHDRIMADAKLRVREMDEAARLTVNELQADFESFKESAAKDMWKQLLEAER
ncbi:MAG: hypothetical protein APF77_08955 [Clostridia bacterium BRH_c25]|nr:MAG: hypothetical protein APF77_08955 [Clostridia bacterium BRH_c25]